MIRKTQSLFFIIFLGTLLLPLISYSAGLVPCGGHPRCCEAAEVPDTNCGNPLNVPSNACCNPPCEPQCQFCHFFVLINNIVGFVLTYLVTTAAVLLFAIAGAMFVFAGGNTQKIEQAKTILSGTVFGLFIVYGAFIFIGMLMGSLGLSDFSLQFTGPDQWNAIICQ